MVTKEAETSQKDNSETDKSEKEDLSKDVYVIAQEIRIVKSLASHDPIQRSKQLKKLQKWLQIRSNSSFPFTEDDFLRLWKGLYFSMWMCDKPLNQEKLAEDLGFVLKCFNNVELSIQFFGAFLKTMCNEWFGIDQWRMDKFMMLVRRQFRAIFEILKDNNWEEENVELFTSQLSLTVLAVKAPTGLAMHVMDIYLEELAKIANKQISAETVSKFIQPFINYLATQKELKLLGYARNRVFYHLLWQSESGREYSEKFNAWEEMGFPTETIDALEKIENTEESEDEEDEITEHSSSGKALDPRAGNVDVFIPALPVDAKTIISSLEEIQYTEITNTKSRGFLKTILEKYKTFASGEFPLGVKKMPKLQLEPLNLLVEQKVDELHNLEETLYGTTRKLKKMNKKKRKKLLSSLNVEKLNEETFDEVIKSTIEGSTKRKRRHSSTSSTDEWLEEEIPIQSSQSSTEQQDNDNNNKIDEKDTTKESSGKKKNKKNKRKKLKQMKQQNLNKIEKENISNAANHNALTSISSGIDEWHETEYIEPEKPAVNKVNSNKNKGSTVKESEEHIIQIEKDENQSSSGWDEPLKDGEAELFIPSRKLKIKQANIELKLNSNGTNNQNKMVLNPFAKKEKLQSNNHIKDKQILLGKSVKKSKTIATLSQNELETQSSPITSQKRVKIVLQKNTVQKPSDYLRQIKRSPQVPYDAEKMPAKGLLKNILTPSPVKAYLKDE